MYYLTLSPAFRRFLCITMSKIAQAEYKAKARFLALLRRRRFSRQRKDRSILVCIGKVRHKKRVHETTSCTPVGFSVGSVGFSVGITRSAASERHFRRHQPVAAHAPSHRLLLFTYYTSCWDSSFSGNK